MFNACILMPNSLGVARREITGSLPREEWADRYRRVFLGRYTRVLRRRDKTKPGDARRRKRVHLRQAHGRTPVPLRTNPRPGLWRRESCDTAVASRQEINRRRR